MAITFSKEPTLVSQRKTQQYLIVILLAAVVVTFFVLWKGFFQQTKVQGVVPRIPQAKNVEIDFGVFQNKIFDQLQTPPPQTLVPLNIGRKNPFAPL